MIKNPCKASNIAFFVYTSANIDIKITPNCGFVPASYGQSIKITWVNPSKENISTLENCMFFIKALPLSPQMNIQDLQ